MENSSETLRNSQKEKKVTTASSWIFIGVFFCVIFFLCALGAMLDIVHASSCYGEEPMENVTVLEKGGLGLCWFLFCLVIFFIGYLALRFIGDDTKKFLWKLVDANLKWCFLIVWIMGFLTYCVGTYVGTDKWPGAFFNILSVVPMAIIHATEMFIGQSDISAIHEEPHNNAYFMLFFNLSHFLAILCSMIFVLLQFGFFMLSQFRIWWHSLFGATRGNLYIFWGLNEKSLTLAESIAGKIKSDMEKEREGGNVKCPESNSKIVFVRTYDDADAHSSNVTFRRLFDMVKLKNKEIESLRRLNCYVTTAFHQLSKTEIKKDDNGKEIDTDILNEQLRLYSLVRFIAKTQGKVHFFTLNEEENLNLNCTRRIVYDTTLKEFSQKKEYSLTIYCHARSNRISRVEEDIHTTSRMEVRILDSSELAVSWLKDCVDYHPVSFVEVNTEGNLGTVASPFHAMIIGFGETGRDAFRFLYEFGAFLDSSSTPQNTKRSPFVCEIVDEHLKDIFPHFKKSTPVISHPDWGKVLDGSRNHKISTYSHHCNSRVFNKKVLSADNLTTLNYVVISLGNDHEGAILAVRILREVALLRDDLSKFRIFLRVFESDHTNEIRHILRHYNQIYSFARKGDIIIPFGDPKELFTYNNIVGHQFRREAMIYSYYYEKMRAEMENTVISATLSLPDFSEIDENVAETAWKNRRRDKLSKGKDVMKLRELRRKESQDIANANHRLTKCEIMRRVKEAIGKELLPSQIDELRENLAITEHLRWNAAHEMLGYTPDREGTSCNEQKKTHNCLIQWEYLDDASARAETPDYKPNYKQYDRIVVLTSEQLNNKNNKKT